jgi:hypothetical protein
MRNGMFTGKFEGPNTSLAVKYGKYDGIGANFRSASPFMQGGVFRGTFEGPRREFNMAQRGAAPPGGGVGRGGVAGGGGGVTPAAGPIGPMRKPPAAVPPPAQPYDFYAALRSAIPPGTMSFGPFAPAAQPYDMRYAALRSAIPPGTMGFGPFGMGNASLKYQDRVPQEPGFQQQGYSYPRSQPLSGGGFWSGGLGTRPSGYSGSAFGGIRN